MIGNSIQHLDLYSEAAKELETDKKEDKGSDASGEEADDEGDADAHESGDEVVEKKTKDAKTDEGKYNHNT